MSRSNFKKGLKYLDFLNRCARSRNIKVALKNMIYYDFRHKVFWYMVTKKKTYVKDKKIRIKSCSYLLLVSTGPRALMTVSEFFSI